MSEQKNFELMVDAKIEVWERSYFKIKAGSESEAVEKLKTLLEKSYLSSFDGDSEQGIESLGGTEIIYETGELIPVEENDGQSTIEIYNNEYPMVMVRKWCNGNDDGGKSNG